MKSRMFSPAVLAKDSARREKIAEKSAKAAGSKTETKSLTKSKSNG